MTRPNGLTYCPDEYSVGTTKAGLPRVIMAVRSLTEGMLMKRLSTLSLLGAMTVAGNAAATGPHSLNDFKFGLLPVYVQVNASGRVTRVSPSVELSPHYDRLLRANIKELITGPATRHSKGVSSAFVINMALKTTPRSDGSYDAQFAYVSAKPVPFGLSHWARIDGHQLTLVRDADNFGSQHWNDNRGGRGMINRSSYGNHSGRSSPPSAPTASSTSARSSNARGASKGR